jgi:hypothetical protein
VPQSFWQLHENLGGTVLAAHLANLGGVPVASKRSRISWVAIFAIITIGIFVILGLLSLALWS